MYLYADKESGDEEWEKYQEDKREKGKENWNGK